MPIKGPKGAVPTTRGWEDPESGELLKSGRITQAQINEWHGVTEQVKPAPTQMLNEAPPSNKSFNDMTKLELESTGRQHGIELDRRKSKNDLIEELEEAIDED
jgi:hypothetical protein